MKYMRSIRTAWPAAAAAVVMCLPGCEQATVSTPVDFPAEELTLSIPPMTRDVASSPVTLPEATGDKGDLTYNLAPIPAGLAFDAATRVLSGTPTAAGNHSVTYTATNATGSKKASLVFTITVRPGLQSTWRTPGREWHDDDGEVQGHFVDTLTFTSGRYVLARSYYFLDGTLDHVWNPSGGWSTAAEGTVIREWEDEEDGSSMSVRKHYVWGSDDHSVLFMHEWQDDHETPADVGLERYDWIPNPVPTLTGVWQATDEWDQGPVLFEMTIGADGTFIGEVREAHGTERFTATWTLDDGNYFLDFQGASSTWTPLGGTAEEPGEEFKADRIAFAPTDSPDLLIVSWYWHETAGNEYRQYGHYWMEFHRQ